MKSGLLFTFFYFAFFWCQAQANIVLQGRVINKDKGEGVSFAHVGLCEKAVGTVSNEDGVFEFKLDPYYLNDTLCVSAIGYETFKIVVENLRDTDSVIIELSPATKLLQDVIILDESITGKRVIEKAVNRIGRNYARKSFLLQGYYRDYLKNGIDYVSFLEGGISIHDRGINSMEAKSSIRIDQLRFSDNYIDNYNKYLHKAEDDTLKVLIEGVSPFFWGNEFSNMLYHNPVRNRNENVPFIGELINFHESSYQFNIAYYTYMGEEEVYVIRFKPDDLFKFHHVQADGEIYIRVKDYAILKFNYNYYISKFGDKRKWYELNLEYREHKDKLFLKYISYMNYFKIFTGYEIAELNQYREFFVTDIKYPDFTPIAEKEMAEKSLPLFKQEVSDDPDFWNNFNTLLLEKPLKD